MKHMQSRSLRLEHSYFRICESMWNELFIYMRDWQSLEMFPEIKIYHNAITKIRMSNNCYCVEKNKCFLTFAESSFEIFYNYKLIGMQTILIIAA